MMNNCSKISCTRSSSIRNEIIELMSTAMKFPFPSVRHTSALVNEIKRYVLRTCTFIYSFFKGINKIGFRTHLFG